jgi:hypothetical protein
MFATRGRRISPAPRLHGVRLESEGEGGGGGGGAGGQGDGGDRHGRRERHWRLRRPAQVDGDDGVWCAVEAAAAGVVVTAVVAVGSRQLCRFPAMAAWKWWSLRRLRASDACVARW